MLRSWMSTFPVVTQFENLNDAILHYLALQQLEQAAANHGQKLSDRMHEVSVKYGEASASKRMNGKSVLHRVDTSSIRDAAP
jgi:hypothetical protein